MKLGTKNPTSASNDLRRLVENHILKENGVKGNNRGQVLNYYKKYIILAL